jgi:hypothetical protein
VRCSVAVSSSATGLSFSGPVTLVSLRNDYPAASQTKIETAEAG